MNPAYPSANFSPSRKHPGFCVGSASAPKGRHETALGETHGWMSNKVHALKGRHDVPPFQGVRIVETLFPGFHPGLSPSAPSGLANPPKSTRVMVPPHVPT
jgi:hypothetical protein